MRIAVLSGAGFHTEKHCAARFQRRGKGVDVTRHVGAGRMQKAEAGPDTVVDIRAGDGVECGQPRGRASRDGGVHEGLRGVDRINAVARVHEGAGV